MDSKLLTVWSQVLDVDPSDLDEDTNFFEAGGDSVAALRLVAAAQAVNIAVDIEDVFNHPTLGKLASKCQEINHPSKPKDNAGEISILDQGTVSACTTACRVERDTIEDIFPASRLQKLVFEAGKAYGTYMLQWVFQIFGELDQNLLVEAWDRLQKKHQIMRTRIVQVGSDHLQVVLQSDMEWQEGKDLAEHKRKSLSGPVESGQPLFRYAVITEGEISYFVWTAHHCGFDGWTRRMMFEQLQSSLSQPLEYAQKANGTSYKDLISWSNNRQKSVSPGYWESVLEGFNGFECVFPLSLERIPKTTSTLSRSWSRNTVNKLNFTMATIAHAAWAISLGNVSGRHDIYMSTTRSGRYAPIPGVEAIFGPMLVVAPVRVKLEKEHPLADFLQSMQNQLVSMTQHERDGFELKEELVGLAQRSQSYLSWHSRAEDVLSKDIPCKIPGGSNVTLKPRRDLSTPFAANFGLTLDVYEQEKSLDFYASWDDSLRSQSDIELLIADFLHNLDHLVGSSHLTVGDLWPNEGRKWAY